MGREVSPREAFSVGLIGCGNMGQALLKGILSSRLVLNRQVMTWHPKPSKLSDVVRRFRIRAARSNGEVAGADVLLLTVKPQQMKEVLKEIRPSLNHQPLVISVAAGISTRALEKWLGPLARVVRVMPNTPALVGKGISAISPGKRATASDLRLTERILSGVGEVVRVRESWMNAVTAVSGSGPAYFFYLMEELIRVGKELGLSPEVSRRLVLETAMGAAQLAKATGEDPAQLRARVTSKGGTTEAAFRVYTRGRLGFLLRRGVKAAARRADQIQGRFLS